MQCRCLRARGSGTRRRPWLRSARARWRTPASRCSCTAAGLGGRRRPACFRTALGLACFRTALGLAQALALRDGRFSVRLISTAHSSVRKGLILSFLNLVTKLCEIDSAERKTAERGHNRSNMGLFDNQTSISRSLLHKKQHYRNSGREPAAELEDVLGFSGEIPVCPRKHRRERRPPKT